MIPKIIHYCWLSGDPLPPKLAKCVDSWRRHMPDYRFMLWDRNRFPEGKSVWVDQAFELRKYAFAADYIRLHALYYYGGFYLDSDVEVLDTFDPFLDLSTMICWQNGVPGLEVAAFGVEAAQPWVKSCLDRYANRPFIGKKGFLDEQVLPEIIEQHLRSLSVKLVDVNDLAQALMVDEGVIPVLPCDYFSPKSYLTGEISLTPRTRCIHHFSSSWKKLPRYTEFDLWLGRVLHRPHFFFFTNVVRYFRYFTHKHQ